MRCIHCGREIIPATDLNGHRFRHETTGFRTCDYRGETWAEPAPEAVADTEGAPF